MNVENAKELRQGVMKGEFEATLLKPCMVWQHLLCFRTGPKFGKAVLKAYFINDLNVNMRVI